MAASLDILVIRSSLVDWQSMKKECIHARHNPLPPILLRVKDVEIHITQRHPLPRLLDHGDYYSKDETVWGEKIKFCTRLFYCTDTTSPMNQFTYRKDTSYFYSFSPISPQFQQSAGAALSCLLIYNPIKFLPRFPIARAGDQKQKKT